MKSVIVLALDLSTSTGFAVFKDGKLHDYGSFKITVKDFNVNDYPERSPEYPKNVLDASNEVGRRVIENMIDTFKPDVIVIENTVKGMNRHTQRILEWIHKAVLDKMGDKNLEKVKYLDPSRWRSIIGLVLSAEDKKHNILVKKHLAKGKITRKHLSVRMANEKFKLELKLKDDDVADAICLGWAWTVKNVDGVK